MNQHCTNYICALETLRLLINDIVCYLETT